jgi:hypothetical protein
MTPGHVRLEGCCALLRCVETPEVHLAAVPAQLDVETVRQRVRRLLLHEHPQLVVTEVRQEPVAVTPSRSVLHNPGKVTGRVDRAAVMFHPSPLAAQHFVKHGVEFGEEPAEGFPHSLQRQLRHPHLAAGRDAVGALRAPGVSFDIQRGREEFSRAHDGRMLEAVGVAQHRRQPACQRVDVLVADTQPQLPVVGMALEDDPGAVTMKWSVPLRRRVAVASSIGHLTTTSRIRSPAEV